MSWQINSYGQTHHNKCSKCLPLALTCALRRFCHWLMLDQWCCVGFPTLLKSFLQAFSLNVFVYDASHWPLQNASFPGDLTGSFVCPWCTLLTECEIIDYINVLSSTWCVRSATPRLSICCAGFAVIKKIIQTVQTSSFLWKLFN